MLQHRTQALPRYRICASTLCERPRDIWSRTQGCSSCLKHHFRRARGYQQSKNARAHQHHSSRTPKHIVERVLLVRSPRCVYAFKNARSCWGKETVPAGRSPKDCSKTLNTFLLPWPSIGNSSAIPLCRVELWKQPQPNSPQKAAVHKTQNLLSYSGQQEKSKLQVSIV